MKRAIILFSLVLLAAGVHAQGRQEADGFRQEEKGFRHEVNVFVGGYFSEFARLAGKSLFFERSWDGNEVNDLQDLYEPHYSLKSGPVLTVTYHYFLNDFLRLGGQVSYGSTSGERWYKLGNKPAEAISLSAFSVLPEAKLCIPSPRHFRLYGKAAAGLQYQMGNLAEKPVGLAWEVVPLGAEWGGHRVYGNAEFCWGNVIRGGRIGIGFSF